MPTPNNKLLEMGHYNTVLRSKVGLIRLKRQHQDLEFATAFAHKLAEEAHPFRVALHELIVENDRLISVRRGIRGGVYAARPDAQDAIRTLARYLRLRGATLADILVVSRQVSEEAVALACGCMDTALRDRLEAFGATIEENDTPAAIIKAEGDLVSLVAQMSGNAAI